MNQSTRSPRRCRECGATFHGERWQRLCWPCWRAQRDRGHLEDEWRRGYDHGYAHGYAAGARDSGRSMRRPSALDLDGELLRRAIALCHPDRHPPERASEANAVTAALLGLRQGLAA